MNDSAADLAVASVPFEVSNQNHNPNEEEQIFQRVTVSLIASV